MGEVSRSSWVVHANFVRHCSSNRGSCTTWKPLAAARSVVGAAEGVIIGRVGGCLPIVSEMQREGRRAWGGGERERKEKRKLGKRLEIFLFLFLSLF